MEYEDEYDDDFGTEQISKTAKRRRDRKAQTRAASRAMSESNEGGSDLLATGMVASGNPYALAGGLAMKTLSANRREKKAQADAKAKLKLERINRQDGALARMMDMSNGLRRL